MPLLVALSNLSWIVRFCLLKLSGRFVKIGVSFPASDRRFVWECIGRANTFAVIDTGCVPVKRFVMLDAIPTFRTDIDREAAISKTHDLLP